MNRNKLFILIFVVVLIFAAAFVYYDSRLINKIVQTAQEPQGTEALAVHPKEETTAVEPAPGNSQIPEGSPDPDLLTFSEAIEVRDNTAEYEMKLFLCQSSDEKTFIRMEYYLNGISVANEVDQGQLPELAGLFDNRTKEQGSKEANKIAQALLNPVFGQLYILIQGTQLEGYYQTVFYKIDLYDMSIKKIFSYPGLYGKMAFNKDYSLLAYSFEDPPVMSVYQEDTLVEVFDCKREEYIIKGNKLADFTKIGSNSLSDFLYDYEFDSWHSIGVLKLKQGVRLLKNPDMKPAFSEVLYHIQKNLLFNPDGSELKQSGSESAQIAAEISSENTQGSGTNETGGESDTAKTGSESSKNGDVTGVEPAKADSEPIKVLKDFYKYLSSEEDYDKAMQLLDDSFILRLSMLKQFGVKEINKRDIDSGYNEENVSMYSQLLKAAKFDVLQKETTKGTLSTVYYFQILGLNADSQVKQFMIAELKKFKNGWKIILIEDGSN